MGLKQEGTDGATDLKMTVASVPSVPLQMEEDDLPTYKPKCILHVM